MVEEQTVVQSRTVTGLIRKQSLTDNLTVVYPQLIKYTEDELKIQELVKTLQPLQKNQNSKKLIHEIYGNVQDQLSSFQYVYWNKVKQDKSLKFKSQQLGQANKLKLNTLYQQYQNYNLIPFNEIVTRFCGVSEYSIFNHLCKLQNNYVSSQSKPDITYPNIKDNLAKCKIVDEVFTAQPTVQPTTHINSSIIIKKEQDLCSSKHMYKEIVDDHKSFTPNRSQKIYPFEKQKFAVNDSQFIQYKQNPLKYSESQLLNLQDSVNQNWGQNGQINWTIVAKQLHCASTNDCYKTALATNIISRFKKWDHEEVQTLRNIVNEMQKHQQKLNWENIAKLFPGKTAQQCYKAFHDTKNIDVEWSDEDIKQLQELIIKQQKQSEKINWQLISCQLNRVPGACFMQALNKRFVVRQPKDLSINQLEVTNCNKQNENQEQNGISIQNLKILSDEVHSQRQINWDSIKMTTGIDQDQCLKIMKQFKIKPNKRKWDQQNLYKLHDLAKLFIDINGKIDFTKISQKFENCTASECEKVFRNKCI